jgi:KUP system potassium uptake protein
VPWLVRQPAILAALDPRYGVALAIQLGYLPRMDVIHTSGAMQGRIYVPHANALLMIACVGLVIGFQNSSALAAAYGIAVTGTSAPTWSSLHTADGFRSPWQRGSWA